MSHVLASHCSDVRVTYPNFNASGPGVVALPPLYWLSSFKQQLL